MQIKFGRLLPFKLRRFLLRVHQWIVWQNSIQEFEKRIKNDEKIDDILLKRLIYGWGNQGFSAQVGYLQTCIEFALSSKKGILECGSGLTTILLGIITHKTNIRMLTLENSFIWAVRVRKMLTKRMLQNVYLHVTPLKDYGLYEWYNISGVEHFDNFDLIICDGPPAQVKGGRYGLLPVMGERIGKGATILLDDTIRNEEKLIIQQWSELKSISVSYVDENDQHAIIRIQD